MYVCKCVCIDKYLYKKSFEVVVCIKDLVTSDLTAASTTRIKYTQNNKCKKGNKKKGRNLPKKQEYLRIQQPIFWPHGFPFSSGIVSLGDKRHGARSSQIALDDLHLVVFANELDVEGSWSCPAT